MFIHNHLSTSLLDTIIVPLIKDKNGNISDADNYRPLAPTSILSKLIESVILHKYSKLLYTTNNQFGFKKKSSTDQCIFALKETINHYKSQNGPCTQTAISFLYLIQ